MSAEIDTIGFVSYSVSYLQQRIRIDMQLRKKMRKTGHLERKN